MRSLSGASVRIGISNDPCALAAVACNGHIVKAAGGSRRRIGLTPHGTGVSARRRWQWAPSASPSAAPPPARTKEHEPSTISRFKTATPAEALAPQARPSAPPPLLAPAGARVGVGTPIAERPLHRSGRAELPHPAPTSGNDAEAQERFSCCLTYPLERAWRTGPALCPECVALLRVPLGPAPSLHHLRRRSFGVVRRLRRYYGPVRLPTSVHHRRASCDFPIRSAHLAAAEESGISRFPRKVRPCMLGVSDRAGPCDISPSRYRRFRLPRAFTASASRSNPPLGG
jgi:hypothetical protein